MYNPMTLCGKKILLIVDGSALAEKINTSLSALGGSIFVCTKTRIEELESALGSSLQGLELDGFVFCVVHSDFRPLRFTKPNKVSEIMDENFGLFIEALRVLQKNKQLKDGASVVAISSISSIRGMKTKTSFCAAKAALDSAVRCLALELGERGIRVNTIQKGEVDVDLSKENIQTVAAVRSEGDARRRVLGVTRAEEIANCAAFLLSDAAPTITGTSFVVDGGYTI